MDEEEEVRFVDLIDASKELLSIADDLADYYGESGDRFTRDSLELSYTCIVSEQISKIDRENHPSAVENVLDHLRVIIYGHLHMILEEFN